jgi:hypothetical protein
LKSLNLVSYNTPILHLENILDRLNNLEELFISFKPENITLLHLPSSVKYIYIEIFNSIDGNNIGGNNIRNPLNFLSSSNVEHIHLNKNISIINYIPNTLQKITLDETHAEIWKIKEKYPHLEINIIKNWIDKKTTDFMSSFTVNSLI